jgi:DNA-binding HxlR family transcriptional regulator
MTTQPRTLGLISQPRGYDRVVDWRDYDGEACSAARALEVLGDRWTMLVLREIFNGVRRFDDISQHIGVARDVLTRRLNALIDEGVVVRSPYQEPGSRTRYEYRLTPAGRDLRPVLLALMAWGDAHRAVEGVPMTVIHPECGEPVHLEMVCEAGHALPYNARLGMLEGPGARRLSV